MNKMCVFLKRKEEKHSCEHRCTLGFHHVIRQCATDKHSWGLQDPEGKPLCSGATHALKQ